MKKLLRPLYLALTRQRFRRDFHPIGFMKKSSFFIGAPSNSKDFVAALPFLENLQRLGNVTLLIPKVCEPFTRYIKEGLFEYLVTAAPPYLFTPAFQIIRAQLKDRIFNVLIALEQPPNLHLPYLVPAERRIAFYHDRAYPYYNILLKGGFEALDNFFNFRPANLKRLFHITDSETRKIDRKIGKRHPLLFVNGDNPPAWPGDTFVLGRDYVPDAALPKVIYTCDAYYGLDNEWRELARLFNKQIIT